MPIGERDTRLVRRVVRVARSPREDVEAHPQAPDVAAPARAEPKLSAQEIAEGLEPSDIARAAADHGELVPFHVRRDDGIQRGRTVKIRE